MRRLKTGGVAMLVVAGLTWPAASASATTGHTSSHLDYTPVGPTPINRLLRLVDLPPGYEVTNDWDGPNGACNEGHAPLGQRRIACEITFGDNWYRPGSSRPDEIESVVLRFDDVPAATAAFESRADLAYQQFDETDDAAAERVPATIVGDDSRIWRWTGSWPQAIVIWRWRHVISMLYVRSPSRHLSEQTVLALAARQQARVATLTPILPAENDDSEVALDNPRLGVPVRWLGRHFDPGLGIAPLSIWESARAYGGGDGPGWSADITYLAERGNVRLALFKPRSWPKFKRDVIGRRIFGFSCTKPTKRIRLAGGWATIQSTKDRKRAPCSRSGNHFFAVAHFPDVVVAVNIWHCVMCITGQYSGAFNTPAALRAVLRGLHPRP